MSDLTPALRDLIAGLATDTQTQLDETPEYGLDMVVSLEVSGFDALRLLEAAHRFWEHPEGDEACEACHALDALRVPRG